VTKAARKSLASRGSYLPFCDNLAHGEGQANSDLGQIAHAGHPPTSHHAAGITGTV
jgi:hypothetical protein